MELDIKAFDDVKRSGTRAAFAPCEISAADKKKWDDTRAALLWAAPAFSHILYTMMTDADGTQIHFTKDLGESLAATDGTRIYANPDLFFQLPLDNRIFVIAHEIMHAIMDHCGQSRLYKRRGKIAYIDGVTLPYAHMPMNIAQDLVINDILIESKIGKFVEGGVHDRNIATAEDSALTAYRKLYDMRKKNKEPAGKGFDEHLEPGEGQAPGKQPEPRDQDAWRGAIAAAQHIANAKGNVPGALDRFFKSLLTPKVNWQEHLRALFARKVGNSMSSWRVLDPQLVVRKIGAPGRMGNGAGKIVVAVDTSGSISQGIMDEFMREVRGIIEDVNPQQLFLVQCDARVHSIDECSSVEDLSGIRMKGGGGTDFRPVFKAIDEDIGTPEALVFLTDGYGMFPKEKPRYTVIWGNITAPRHKVDYPFGDVVDIDMTDA